MARLSHVCMQIPLFRKVSGTHKMHTKPKESVYNIKSMYKWTNTNKLLGYRLDGEGAEVVEKYQGIKGCKTGITVPAGPCMSAYIEKELTDHESQKSIEHIIVILLNSKTMEIRWVE